MTEPSDVAVALAEVTQGLCDRDAIDLERLLAREIGFPSPAALREARLGLLIEMVSSETGEIPGTAHYEALRQERAAACHGDRWPAASRLIEAYGSWLQACSAAMRLIAKGTRSKVPHSNKHTGRRPTYKRSEAIEALQKFYASFGRWPSTSEWGEWSGLSRRLARERGLKDPRLPHLRVILRLFGSFERAVTVARSDL